MTSTVSTSERMPWEPDEPVVQLFDAPGFPPGHPAEPDLFVRQFGVPGHNQDALERARVVLIGAGGLGSWAGLGLVRSGVHDLTIIDPDRFSRTNAHRQLMLAEDIGRNKAVALGRNLLPHMIAGGQIRAIGQAFGEAAEQSSLVADLLVVLVDNNTCRLEACRWAREQQIPAVFAMLSLDGTRIQTFLQGGGSDDACLWCALPNLDQQGKAPCASGTISPCYLAAAHVVFFAYRALMRWPDDVRRFNWHEMDMLGGAPAHHGQIARRPACAVCGA
jgi:molybdopterin/thiamine biosynthesis adenylyltransferase